MSKLKDIELNRQYLRVSGEKPKLGRNLLLALPLVLLAAVLLGAWQYLALQNSRTQRQLDTVSAALLDKELTADISYSHELEAYQLELAQILWEAQQQNTAISSYPVVRSSVLDKLESCSADVVRLQLKSYDSDTGLLQFDAVTETVLDIPAYIMALSDTGLFEQVNYTGYQYAEKDGVYSIQVACYLRADTGREAAK